MLCFIMHGVLCYDVIHLNQTLRVQHSDNGGEAKSNCELCNV